MSAAENKKGIVGRFGWSELLIGGLIVVNGFLLYKVNDLTNQYNAVQEEVKQSRQANEQVLSMLKTIRDEQEQQTDKINKAMNITHKKILSKNNVMLLKSNGYTEYTDLGENVHISVEEMDKIIQYYEKANGKTAFSGHAATFVEAAEETGLNPIYIFAHAATESAFGTSHLAVARHNYFGINAVDNDPGLAYSMGSSLDEGIKAGARWIKQNYYNKGYTTLASMHQAGYASDPSWSSEIASLANSATQVL
jgi:beta-N-acetylglucosaminidase